MGWWSDAADAVERAFGGSGGSGRSYNNVSGGPMESSPRPRARPDNSGQPSYTGGSDDSNGDDWDAMISRVLGSSPTPTTPTTPTMAPPAPVGPTNAERAADQARQTGIARGRYDTAVANANAAATDDFNRVFGLRGADPANFADDLAGFLGQFAPPEFSYDYAGYGGTPANQYNFTADRTGAAEALLNDIVQTRFVNPNVEATNLAFPEYYGANTIGDTADDAILADILGSQYDDAMLEVNRARDRGSLNQRGYDEAMSLLGDQRTAGDAILQQLGGGVLQTGRDSLEGVRSDALTSAGTYDFTDPFDLSTYTDRAGTLLDEFNTGLEGNLRATVGGERFFDTNTLLQNAGRSQGFVNPAGQGAPGILSALAERDQQEQRSRGLGSTGSF